MERRSQRTVCLRAAEYYPGCALIRDLQGDHQLNRSEGRHSPNIKTKAGDLVVWRAERAGFCHFTQDGKTKVSSQCPKKKPRTEEMGILPCTNSPVMS